MNEKTIELITDLSDVDFDEDDMKVIGEVLDKERTETLKEAVTEISRFQDEDLLRAAGQLVGLIGLLALEVPRKDVDEEEEEEEEGKTKKVQKSPSWSFTLGSKRED